MDKKRVVITSMGTVSPIGNTVEENWQSILDLKSGIEPIDAFDLTDFRVSLAAQVKNLVFEDYLDKRELKFNDRFTQFARIAAMQAMNNVNFEDKTRVGVILGSGIGGIQSISNA